MKLAIIGSRHLLTVNIEKELTKIPDTIVSGGAIGVDSCARDYARRHGLKLIEYFPDYQRYGGGHAPLVRNRLIVDECDCLLAFWGGMTECHPACEQLGFIPQSEFLRSKSFTSRGTKYTIDYATKIGKPMKIVKV